MKDSILKQNEITKRLKEEIINSRQSWISEIENMASIYPDFKEEFNEIAKLVSQKCNDILNKF